MISCSTKKNTFLSRNTHTMSTKFNVLYNGNIAFDEAKKQLDEAYEDNYWERLPIEPLKIEEEAIPMPGQSLTQSDNAQGFDKAEEKAVKSIQKHSMVIDGLEKNKQIDEAYLLLGKSRYYLQRFVPALEAFTFALNKYPNANLFDDTRIWKAKTHVRLQNEELAIETLKLVLKSFDLSDENYEDAHTAMAMAYTQLDSTHLVIDHLKKSTYYFKDEAQSARNFFILGQIYREQNKIDSSNMVFESLAYMKKIPRKYKIHAILERAKNYITADSTDVITLTIKDLIEDRDNRPYLDELYYQLGLITQKQENVDLAYAYFENSVQYNSSKPFQKGLAYEKLGDINFDKTQFELAGSFYDSVLQMKQDKNTRRIRKIIRKRESLNDVIYYENIVKRNDSILYISSLSDDEQKEYFQIYVSELKAKEEEEKAKRKIEKLNTGIGDLADAGGNSNNKSGVFYFYNASIVSLGKIQFKNKYGNRTLSDFWLISNSTGPATELVKNTVTVENDSLKYDISFYISQIPKSKTALDSISKQRNDAYYNLGLIYKEQFKEYEMAAEDFENFLQNDPSPNLILPTKYHLFKTYSEFNPDLSNKYKDEIVNNYPDSRYAEIIKNPNRALDFENDEDSPEYIYKNAYVCFEEEEYQYALSSVNEALKKFKGIEIEAKFELLKAFLLFNTKGEQEFIDKLNFVIVNYPNTEESDHAEKVLEQLKERSEKKGKL